MRKGFPSLAVGRDVARPRLIVLGLDSVSPDLLERFRAETPRLQQLLARSSRGTLLSCDPPITVPAWAVMFSGADPGQLGLYGFRHRRLGSYASMYIPDSSTPRLPMLWEDLSRTGRRVAVVGMPPGYPPPSVNGVYVSDFLTPDSATDWAYPQGLVPELAQVAGGPFFDVSFRVDDRSEVARNLLEMTRRRWRAVRYLWAKEPWDLFAVHEIGPDRVHHAFWKYFDRAHPRHVEDPELSRVASEFYSLLDLELGRFLDEVGSDVPVLAVSDHGSQAMEGCFRINQWLVDKGYLRLRDPPSRPGLPLEEAEVDWSQTQVWGAGGYYARLFLNLEGREPSGTVRADDRETLVAQLHHDLDSVRRPDGTPLGVKLFSPQEVYADVQGDPPDLMAYFGDLKWRSAGTVGHDSWFTMENDTGPDDAVHSFDGFFAYFDPRHPAPQALPPQPIQSVGPALYAYFGLPVPAHSRVAPLSAFQPKPLAVRGPLPGRR
jgi:predicted AlkP superfamily phosphohydrolase/phosphomutase